MTRTKVKVTPKTKTTKAQILQNQSKNQLSFQDCSNRQPMHERRKLKEPDFTVESLKTPTLTEVFQSSKGGNANDVIIYYEFTYRAIYSTEYCSFPYHVLYAQRHYQAQK